MLPETLPGLVNGPSNGDTDHPFDPGPQDGDGADMESESFSGSAASPRRSNRQCQEPDRCTAGGSVRSEEETTGSLVPCLLTLIGLLFVVIVVPSPDVMVVAAVVTAAGLCIMCMSLFPQLKMPPYCWAGHR